MRFLDIVSDAGNIFKDLKLQLSSSNSMIYKYDDEHDDINVYQ